MFKQKTTLPKQHFRILTLSADFYDNENADAITCCSGKNFRVKNGKLLSVESFEPVSDAESGALFAAKSVDGSCLTVTKDGIFCGGNHTKATGFVKPCSLNFPAKKQTVVSDAAVGTFILNEKGAVIKQDTVGYISMAANQNRVFFCSADNKIFVSDCRNLLSTEGYIGVPEKIVKLVEWRGDILAVGDKIYKLEMFDNYENSKLSVMCDGVGRVYPQTVAAADKTVVFFTGRGLFCYNGSKITKVELNDRRLENVDGAVAACYGGRYWLALPRDKDGCCALLSFDLGNMMQVAEYYVETSFLSAGADWLFVGKNGIAHCLAESVAPLFWKSNKADFGCKEAKKHLRQLKIRTVGDLDLTVVTETDKRIFHFKGQPTPQKVKLCGSCHSLCVEMTAEARAEVSCLEIVAQTFDEV